MTPFSNKTMNVSFRSKVKWKQLNATRSLSKQKGNNEDLDSKWTSIEIYQLLFIYFHKIQK